MTTYFINEIGPGSPGDSANYAFSPADLAELEEEINFRQVNSTSPGMGGKIGFNSLLDASYYTLSGTAYREDGVGGGIRSLMDDIKKAIIQNQGYFLYLDNDRYIRVFIADTISVSKTNRGPYRNWSVRFVCTDDPPWQGLTLHSTTVASGVYNSLGIACNGMVYPTITFIVSAVTVGAGVSIVLQSFYGGTLQILPSSTGTYIVDMLNRTVTVGGVDRIADVVGGDFFTLKPLSTEGIQYNKSGPSLLLGTLTISSCNGTFYDRWY